jgi:hypothetical protein
MGFELVIGFVGLLKLVTTKNYSAIANSHTLQFTVAHNKSSQFISTGGCLVKVPNSADSSASVYNGFCPHWLVAASW